MRGTASFAVESAAPRQSKMRAPPIEHENPRQSNMRFRTNEKTRHRVKRHRVSSHVGVKAGADPLRKNLAHSGSNTLGVEAVLVQKLQRRAGLAERVANANTAHGHRALLAQTAAHASPRPPIMECSSTVTTWPVLEAEATSASESSGLMVCMLTTSAEIPSAARTSAASSAADTISRKRRWTHRCPRA